MSELTEATTTQPSAPAAPLILPVTHPNRITGTWRRSKGQPLEHDHPSLWFDSHDDPC